MKVEQMEQTIREIIEEILEGQIKDMDVHLLSDNLRGRLVDWLYVFDALEKKLGYPVAQVLEDHDYTIFTVHNLAQAICERWRE